MQIYQRHQLPDMPVAQVFEHRYICAGDTLAEQACQGGDAPDDRTHGIGKFAVDLADASQPPGVSLIERNTVVGRALQA
ncbi:MAG: hypothetical protein WBN02_13070 [Sedimenticolaceae bacterium]